MAATDASLLLRLPVELQENITSFVTNKKDLNALCLTSKHMRQVSMPKLYRSVDMLLGGPQQKLYHGFLDRRHPGVQFIRDINIELGTKRPIEDVQNTRSGLFGTPPPQFETPYKLDSGFRIENSRLNCNAAYGFLTALLAVLSPNILRGFNWPQDWCFPHDLWLQVHKTQDRLSTVEISALTEDLQMFDGSIITESDEILDLVEKNSALFTGGSKPRSLKFRPTSRVSLKVCQTVLERNPSINILSVQGDDFQGEEDDLFGAMLYARLKSPINTSTLISHLHLDSLNLKPIPTEYLITIDFSNLESLVLSECYQVLHILEALNQDQHLPSNLKCLAISYYGPIVRSDAKCPIVDCLDTLLTKISGLETLHVRCSFGESLPDLDAVLSHSKTLKHLSISTGAHGDIRYDLKSMKKVCNKCVNLEDLRLDFPYIDVTNDRWAESGQEKHEFVEFLQATRKLTKLKTLNMGFFWYKTRSLSNFVGEFDFDKAEPLQSQVQRVMERIFTVRDRDHPYGLASLEVLAAGRSNKANFTVNNYRMWEKAPIFFMRGRVVDPIGDSKMRAVSVSEDTVRNLVGSRGLFHVEDHLGWD